MVNITGQLLQKPEFAHVKYLKRRVTQINSEQLFAVDNSIPATFRMSNRLSRDKRRD